MQSKMEKTVFFKLKGLTQQRQSRYHNIIPYLLAILWLFNIVHSGYDMGWCHYCNSVPTNTSEVEWLTV